MENEKNKVDKEKHWKSIKEGFEETKREKKKVFGFQKKIAKRMDFRKRAIFKGKFTHGTRGKPTHGPRGSQG